MHPFAEAALIIEKLDQSDVPLGVSAYRIVLMIENISRIRCKCLFGLGFLCTRFQLTQRIKDDFRLLAKSLDHDVADCLFIKGLACRLRCGWRSSQRKPRA